MNLLNGVLAFGALAFSIPLVIHLFFRSRFQTIDWGAMHLLQAVVQVNRRRMQLANLLLLLLRCLIPVILAFCLARPVWTGLKAVAGDTPKTLIIAIDDSRSMSLTPQGQPSLLEQAKEQLRSVLGELSRRDEVILVRSSRVASVPSKMGVSEALTKLRKLSPEGGPTTIGQLLEAAVVAAQDATHRRRQIVLLSDFQECIIDATSLETAQRVADETKVLAGQGVETYFDFIDLQPDWDAINNVSVDSVSVQSPVVVRQRAGVYEATIRNSGEAAANDVRLVWSIDGQSLDPRTISVDAKSVVTNRLTQTIDDPGQHLVTAMIDRSDMLIEDNHRGVVVDVMSAVNVLLVDGKPSSRPLGGQADFLAIALSPFAFGGDDRPDPVKSSVVTVDQMPASISEDAPRVVILADVPALQPEQRSTLVDFVNQGGALVVFDGPDVDIETYNATWQADGQSLSFPAVLGTVNQTAQEDSDQGLDSAKLSFSIDRPNPQYDPWKVIANGNGNPFSDVTLNAYRRLSFDKTLSPEAQSAKRVLMQTTAGDLLAVAAPVGEGTIVQFAFTANDAWSNLPLRPVFLPMVSQMVLDLAGKREQWDIPVGQPLVLDSSDFEATDLEASDNSIRWSVTLPDGEVAQAMPSGDEVLRFTDTYQEGLYTIARRSAMDNQTAAKSVPSVVRLVSVDANESSLRGAGQQQIDRLRESLQASLFDDASGLNAADRTRQFGREIWRWLWCVLLVALVAELWLQQNVLAKRRVQGGIR
ncbi:BatA domain-containing protein [Rhodopirellula sp. MGV]|uniref:BatA domain-containing protein n=1 Tax=Rhodopirellula sp. MGV TaxID=2023130 RepID=UPI000B97B7D8|nr:BatA domain-containing protein [Rhodopirellula sp. MGV]OYP36827.1 hypothetical protein CGZ80_07205 [Rhodopirellula sp. MGV]PNY36466.1 VWA domain-containing protein [Rhodopirellula baltica]